MKSTAVNLNPKSRLLNKNFTLLVAGQLISIFGNQILTFALPLHILQTQESAAMFGTVLGLSFLPLIIASPIGGIMADRLKKQMIMFWLDVVVFVSIVLFMMLSGVFAAAIVPIVIIKLIALNITQGMYMPCVQGGTPLIVPPNELTRANSVTSGVNTISSMIAPGVAGFLLGMFGLQSILVVSLICFAITAVMDLCIRFPYEKQQARGGIAQIVKNDMAQALRFVSRRPLLIKMAVMMIITPMFVFGVLMIAMPVFILQNLGISMEIMGIGRSVSWVGGLVGVMVVGILGERLTIKIVPLYAVLMSLSIAPIGIAVMIDMPVFAAFAIMIASDFAASIFISIFWIPIMAYIQKITPEEQLGKVMSLFVALPFVASGLGSLLFGVLLDSFYAMPWIIIFASVFIVCVTTLILRKDFINTDKF